jgi:hypothetical protein
LIDQWSDDFPEEYDFATGVQAPWMLRELMLTVDCAAERPFALTVKWLRKRPSDMA